MNMVSESDRFRQGSSQMQNASAGPGAAGSGGSEVNIFKTTYSFIAMTYAADQRFDA